jgi:hypothetical protein
MFYRLLLVAILTLVWAAAAPGQTIIPNRSAPVDTGWRPAGEAPSVPRNVVPGDVLAAAATMPLAGPGLLAAAPTPAAAPAPTPAAPLMAANGSDPTRQPITRVTPGSGTLPNDHGQVWREYDISPYTVRVTATERPEQALVDWILRETGYEAWHGEPLGVLSATRRSLRVYHTPEMQAVVAELVDRFVGSEAETFAFSLRVVSLDQPNWRIRAQRFLKPVNVQSPGVSAWLMAREEASALMAELQKRTDFREHTPPHLLVNNGQATVISGKRPRTYVRDLVMRPDAWPGYEALMGQVEEGCAFDFSPLLSLDRRLIDATLKCEIDQVEKITPVALEFATAGSARQRAKVEVPQMTHFRFHERFRWPVDQVLVVGMGMVALPMPVDNKPNIAGIPLPIATTPPRADLLVFVEARGSVFDPSRAAMPAASAARDPNVMRW